MYVKTLKNMSVPELLLYAKNLNIQNISSMRKEELIVACLFKKSEEGEEIYGEGVLEILPDGFGFLRSVEGNYLAHADDFYVDTKILMDYNLRTGDTIEGKLSIPLEDENYFSLENILKVNFQDVEALSNRVHFDNLTPLYPDDKLNLDVSINKDLTTRVIDIISPLGKGQRAIIVAPPRTGKTVVLQNIAHAIEKNNPEVYLIVLLIDERPEEVTDMKRSVKGEVVSSTFDEPASRHIQVADIIGEKAKRLVEQQKDVVILLDSITRLGRAYNTIIPSSGKVLTGGVDSNALQRPKRFFGAARNAEEGGSLTIIATALIETGSRMDEVIFEEFKGTGNSEIVLDRRIADRRIFPAIDIFKSGTRKEELLVDKSALSKMWILRKVLSQMNPLEGIELLLSRMKNTKDNEEFFNVMTRG